MLVQSNPVNTDTEGTIESVRINGVRIKRVMLFKSTIKLLLDRNTLEIKQGISIVKLNISNVHKAIITWTMSVETLKSSSFIHYILYQKPPVHLLPKYVRN